MFLAKSIPSMPATDTPPASPSVVREDPDEGEEPLDAADAIEVIDLDEGEDMEDDEEDDEDGDPDDLDASMQGQAASDTSASASRLEAPPEDNSTLTFSEHGSKNIRIALNFIIPLFDISCFLRLCVLLRPEP